MNRDTNHVVLITMSKIFSPFRAVGFCCNSVPLSLSVRGSTALIATAVGKAFHVYNCAKIHLLFVSPPQEDSIVYLIQDRLTTYIAVGKSVKCFKRGKQVWCLEGHNGFVHTLLLVGQHLIAIDDRNSFKVWDRKTKELYTELHFDSDSFEISCIVHPSTYLNKVLVGSKQGSLQLWNIRNGKLIHTFNGWNSSVLVLVQSPALDIIGIGLHNGNIILHNIRYDNTLMSFIQEWGPVINISFRTDGVNSLVTSSTKGHIAVWNLDEQKLDSVLHDAHSGSVNGLSFLPQQPTMITSSSDNSIKMWIFDQSDGSARLLKQRQGHSAPPTLIRFNGNLSILSAGLDNALRVMMLHCDSVSRELSQGHVTSLSNKRNLSVNMLKVPAIIDFSFELTRFNEWDCVVSCHHGNRVAHTWNLSNFTIGKHNLKSHHIGAKPLCCCISGCGNFVLLGMTTGHIEIFNIQSGLYRGQLNTIHTGPVRGVAINSINTQVYTGGSDGLIKVWSFHDRKYLRSISVNYPVSKMCYHRNSSLLAVALDSFLVLILDMETCRVVRRFKGHYKRITDMVFSSDSRWLITCSMDCVVRTWDIPSGHLIDCFLLEAPPTSISLSSNGEYMACSIVDDLGIYIWSNKTVYSNVSLHPISPSFIPQIHLPSTGEEDQPEEEEEEEECDDQTTILQPLETGLLTLSSLPKSHWSNLLNLDTIKERNKPKEPVKPVKPAPFFLPTLPGPEIKFVQSEEDMIPTQEPCSKVFDMRKLMSASAFHKVLLECDMIQDFVRVSSLLKTMGPSEIDREIQLMDDNLLSLFLKFLLSRFKTNDDFELNETYLHLVLKYHKTGLYKNRELVEEIQDHHVQCCKLVQYKIDYCLCLLSYCKNASVY